MKAAAQHTPGPWRVNYERFSEVLAENGALVATCSLINGLTTTQANAGVIAQAPAMFAMAVRLAAISEALANGSSAAEAEACRLADEARAIVARSRGEA